MSGKRRIVLLVAASIAAFAPILFAPSAGSAALRHAGVVVVHGDDSVETECVAFTSKKLTGFDLLNGTHFDVLTTAFDVGGSQPDRAICWLDGEGQGTGTNCFGGSSFWSYWTQNKGESQPVESQVGSQDRFLKDGAVDYWVFGTPPIPAPSAVSFDSVCGP